jgi:hypothetical protein
MKKVASKCLFGSTSRCTCTSDVPGSVICIEPAIILIQ